MQVVAFLGHTWVDTEPWAAYKTTGKHQHQFYEFHYPPRQRYLINQLLLVGREDIGSLAFVEECSKIR